MCCHSAEAPFFRSPPRSILHFELRREANYIKNMTKLLTLIHKSSKVVQPIKKRKFETNPPRDNFPQLGLIYNHIELMMADRDIIT